ncbi:MAG: FAD-dependent oxidoreductase [Boseongicola sp.]|nr:FAD-dependent oxidoreductase [Boseongicola sp.]
MQNLEQSNQIAIVGAGVAGLTAAILLTEAGHQPILFDKGRKIGGRLATRRTPAGLFDYGSPEVPKSGPWSSLVREPRLLPGHGLRQIFDRIDTRFGVQNGVEIAAISQDRSGWSLATSDNRSIGQFANVLITSPAPQAKNLLDPLGLSEFDDLASVQMVPVWTVLVAFDEHLDCPDEVSAHSDVLAVRRMNGDGAAANHQDRWVIQFTPEFSTNHFDAEKDTIADSARNVLSEAAKVELPPPTFLHTHRWRYAFAGKPLGRSFICSQEMGILAGGDWALGRTVEDAVKSGAAMAHAVLSSKAVAV